MSHFKDLTGQRFGRLVALERVSGARPDKTYWRCKCDCGRETVTGASSLMKGTTKSCSCIRTEKNTKHGLAHHPLFRTWAQMMARCYEQKNNNYPRYGGRGITVCDRWKDATTFIQDNEGKKKPGLTLDRIDNNKGYSPENCRWATSKVQTNNRSSSVLVTFEGRTLSLTDWGREFGVDYITVRRRIEHFGIEKGFATLAPPCCPNCGVPQPVAPKIKYKKAMKRGARLKSAAQP